MAEVIRMPRSPVVSARTEQRNRLLAALPAPELSRLSRHFVTIPALSRQVLQRAGEPIRHVYFPVDSVFSVMTALPEGASTESAAVGREGMLGIEAFFHDDARALGDTLVQIPGGFVERLDVQAFREALDRNVEFRSIVGGYAASLLAQTMQAAACNALHKVEERLAKWLLLADDRLDGVPDFRISHEALASVLGTRRQTVTGIACAFQEAGLIAYKHARVKVLDRHGLEAASCSCYRMIRDHSDRQFLNL